MGIKWNIARLHGPVADLFFFLKEDEKTKTLSSPIGQEEVNIVMALTVYEVAETHLYMANSTRGFLEIDDDSASVSSGNMSLDLADMCRYGFPKSLDWDGDLDLDSAEEARESGKDHLRHATESPLWVSVRDFLMFSTCV